MFNSRRTDNLLFAGSCAKPDDEWPCERTYYNSVDGGASFNVMTLAHSCIFAASAQNLSFKDSDEKAANAVLCAASTPQEKDGLALVLSYDFFDKEPNFVFVDGGIVTGVSILGSSDHYILAVGSHMVESGSFAYLSYDARTWTKIEIPHLPEASFEDSLVPQIPQILQSSEGTLLISVNDGGDAVSLYGTSQGSTEGSYLYFKPRLEKLSFTILNGFSLHYESIEALSGVAIANTEKGSTMITLDNGIRWERPTLKNCDKSGAHCFVNLYFSFPENQLFTKPRMFSTKIPGLLLGVGSVGETLKEIEDCDTFVSWDAGLTWTKTLDGPHLFEVGDSGAVIVAITELDNEGVVKFSLDFGQTWSEIKLQHKLRPEYITTTVDSTSSSFLIVGHEVEGSNKILTVFLDFEKAYKSNCKARDFETWYLWNADSKPVCMNGHKWAFQRRKTDAKCSVKRLFKEPELIEENCPCEISDYECAFGFHTNSEGDQCVADIMDSSPKAPAGCENDEKTHMVPSGFVLTQANKCDPKSGLDLLKPVEAKCPTYSDGTDEHKVPAPAVGDGSSNPDEKEGNPENAEDGNDDGKVKTLFYTFKGKTREYIYLRSDNADPANSDETVIVLTDSNDAYVSHDQGSTWEQVAPGEEILAVFLNPSFADDVFLLAASGKLIYSLDRGDNWKSFKLPSMPKYGPSPLVFHPLERSTLLFLGQENCETSSSKDCHSTLYITKSYGQLWTPIEENIESCIFPGFWGSSKSDNTIVCEKSGDDKKIPSSLVVTTDNFSSQKELLTGVVGFAEVSRYLVSAVVDDNSLTLMVSADGSDFDPAEFPVRFNIDKSQAYTTLSDTDDAILVHVTTNTKPGAEFGTLLKSNNLGYFYSVSLDYVNRDSAGYVDYERMPGIEGVLVVNTVSNPAKVKKGAKKALRTMITHNDGGRWRYLQPPETELDAGGVCSGKSLEECSLNLHGFTERSDLRDTFSSESALGMMIGVGNVGEKLTPYHEGNTYMTIDAGITWKQIKKGVYMWEYGDHGSVIVLVNGKDTTDTLSYSIDRGMTWVDYKFSNQKVKVQDISTIPSDMSLKVLLFTKVTIDSGEKTRIFQLNFEKLFDRECSGKDEDFELWSLNPPFQNGNCLLGTDASYKRKKTGRMCYVGKDMVESSASSICECSAEDFECSFGYHPDGEGNCVEDEKISSSDVCFDDDIISYTPGAPYRKIPSSKCEGGLKLDQSVTIRCPHGSVSGSFIMAFVLFMVIVLVLGALVYAVFVYQHYRKTYGVIRLDDDGTFDFENHGVFENANAVIASGIIAGVAHAVQFAHKTRDQIGLWLGMLVNRVTGRDYQFVNSFEGLGSAYVVADDYDDDLFGDTFGDDATELEHELSDDEDGDLANFRR